MGKAILTQKKKIMDIPIHGAKSEELNECILIVIDDEDDGDNENNKRRNMNKNHPSTSSLH